MQRLTEIRAQWNVKIFEQTPDLFETLALEAFSYQYQLNPVYRAFVDALGVDPAAVRSLLQIPFLPISFFKTARVVSADSKVESNPEPLLFESSGTTQSIPSVHRVADPSLYKSSFLQGFTREFGAPSQWCVLALLPSYLERKNSSLVYMASHLIELSGHEKSGFYLQELDKLRDTLFSLEQQQQPTLLLGVSFALLDFASHSPMPLRHTTLIETGGMKGRGPELTREELHERLQQAFTVPAVYSEYGMTELLSQGWSTGNGIFQAPPWMKISVREEYDPLAVHAQGAGALNIIDLANIDSCCFIATEDSGAVHADGKFEVKGRIDFAALRGCSLMTV